MFFAFSLLGKALSRCPPGKFLCRHEVLIPSIHREHVADHLPGNCQRGPIAVPPLQFSGTNFSEFMALPRSQFGGFNQHSLVMCLFSLLGDLASAFTLVGRALLISAKPAVADRLLDRCETRHVSDLQSPTSAQ